MEYECLIRSAFIVHCWQLTCHVWPGNAPVEICSSYFHEADSRSYQGYSTRIQSRSPESRFCNVSIVDDINLDSEDQDRTLCPALVQPTLLRAARIPSVRQSEGRWFIQDGMLGAHPAYRSVHLHPQHKQTHSVRHILLLDSCLLMPSCRNSFWGRTCSSTRCDDVHVMGLLLVMCMYYYIR